MPTQLSIHRLPLPSRTLQSSLPQLELDASPVAQRRSTTFKTSTPGVWARVNPLWTSWPLRLTRGEVEEMGVDVEEGGQVSVVDVLKRWDPVDAVEDGVGAGEGASATSASAGNGQGGGGGLGEDRRKTSSHRLKLEPYLLGVPQGVLNTELPHLDAGDAIALSSGSNETFPEQDSAASIVRDQLVNVLSGRHVITHERYGPWSTRYCGHQFGVWAGQLGDGRAISILETTSEEGGRQEVQLKGAGRTPFSRHADGLAVLRSGVREYLGAEAVAALGIPTTRSFALLTASDLPVIRETGPEPTSLTARIAPSFIRIGHFQALNPGAEGRSMRQIFLGGGYLSQGEGEGEGPMKGQGNLRGLGELTRWCMGIMQEQGWNEGGGVRAFFNEVVRRNAEMVAGWQVYGFCHGVINTDNVSVLGLTIDYGPYAFMDVYDENHICNPSGLYSYANQPSRILFALDKLQQALAPLIGFEIVKSDKGTNDDIELPESLDDGGITADTVQGLTEVAMQEMKGWEEEYWKVERAAEAKGWGKRFGLLTDQKTDRREVTLAFLRLLHMYDLDMSSAFRRLAHVEPTAVGADDEATSDLRDFVDDLMARCKPSSSNASNAGVSMEEERQREAASTAWSEWFRVYAKRVSESEEVAAWESSSSVTPGAMATAKSNEKESAADANKDAQTWQAKRKASMLSANPRFVLRQWVLEELIKDMDDALSSGDERGRRDARKRLNAVMEMATHPFESYGEDLPAQSDACPSPEVAEQRRLCGLGSKDMLGFQCSCSS